MQSLHLFERGPAVFGLTDHLKLVMCREPGAHDLAHDRIVIGEQYCTPLVRCWNSALTHYIGDCSFVCIEFDALNQLTRYQNGTSYWSFRLLILSTKQLR